jgi:diaminopimelate decarboxylase
MAGPVTGFLYDNGLLACDGVALPDIAALAGTPVYVYSGGLLAERYQAFEAPFAGVPHALHYAIKANATLAILRRLRELGAGADANSGGEIELALAAGFEPRAIVFTGVGKTRAELERAVALDLAAVNVESPGELARIAALADAAGRTVRVAVRVNPDVDAGTHPHIATGSSATKFGMSIDDARALVRDMASRPSVRVVGLHVHIGSQITTPEPIARAVDLVADLARSLVAEGVPLEHLDVGGGLGIAYRAGQPTLSPEAYAAAILPAVRRSGLRLLLEPGRWLVGPCGVLLTEVVDLKSQAGGERFVIVDAGMNDLLRPALYGAWHGIDPVRPRPGAPLRVDVVGPVCETADTLGAARDLPPLEVGDLLAVRDAGAYGAVMASNYNRRPLPAEVLVDRGHARLVRRRQTAAELRQWDE